MKHEDSLLFRTRVLSSDKLSGSCSLVVFERPAGFNDAKPGQFISIRVSGSTVPLLRRPFSIMDLDSKGITVLVKVVGPASRILAGSKPGDTMEIAGPLGGTWFDRPAGDTAVMVGGGTGLAPMIFCARTWRREDPGLKVLLYQGAATADELLAGVCGEDFTEVHNATIDGSAGFRGDVVALLAGMIEQGKVPGGSLYSCGPRGMVKALEEKVAGSFDIHMTSLESVMACGVGACRGCTVPFRSPKGIAYKAVCSDGTVFPAQDIAWEDWKE